MADLSITATQVLAGSKAVVDTVVLGGTVTAGMPLYKNSSGTYQAAQCDGTSTEATVTRFALAGGSSGQTIAAQVCTAGSTITIGAAASITEGLTYRLSDTAGGIAPISDALSSTWFTTILGVGDGSNGIVIGVNNSGQQTA